MTVLMISMPYAKFDSDWFALVPNVNLGSTSACLAARDVTCRTFHFHMDFAPFLSGLPTGTGEKFRKLSGMGVEYFSLDYIFATLLFPEVYLRSTGKISERTAPLGLNREDLEEMRDAADLFIDRCLERLKSYLPGARLAAFSSSHFQLSSSLLLASKIKKIRPEILVAIGGKDCAGASGSQIINRFPFIDFVGYGECEPTVLSIIGHPGHDPGPPKGVLYRKKKGKTGQSDRPVGMDLDLAPFPDYTFESLPVSTEKIIVPLELGRGCTWGRCTFCPDHAYGIECRKKKAEKVAAEIDHYLSISPELTRYIIVDADALKDTDEIAGLAALLKDKGLTIVFGEFRAERLNRKTLSDLMAFGRWGSQFQVGVEAFSDRLLDLMNKGIQAIRNVEAIKAAAELGAPLQFNIITSFPRMERRDLEENLRVIDLIRHLLAAPNIKLYPSEFYLPPDCEIYERDGYYRIRKTRESTFSAAFEDFDFNALGNYPHYLAFDNHNEQMKMSGILRKKIADIEEMSPSDCSLRFSETGTGLVIESKNDDVERSWSFSSPEKEMLLAAVDGIKKLEEVVSETGVSLQQTRSFLDMAEKEGLIIYSADRNSYLSLATR